MLDAITALLPVIILMSIGRLLAAYRVINADGWHGIDTLTYQLLYPAMIIFNLVRVDFASLPTIDLGATLLCAILTMSGFLLLLRPVLARFLHIEGPAFTSIFQGVSRWMASVALVLSAGLYGPEGVALVSIAMVAMIPVLNIINVSVLSLFADGKAPGPGKFLLDLAKNPFIWSCAIGVTLNLLGLSLPGLLMQTLESTGKAALSIGLLCVGAGLDVQRLRKPGPRIFIAVGLRLIGMPLTGAFWAGIFGLEGIALGVAIVCMAVPTASAAYLLARKMGGDSVLMAEIVAFQSLAAIVTFPLAIAFLGP